MDKTKTNNTLKSLPSPLSRCKRLKLFWERSHALKMCHVEVCPEGFCHPNHLDFGQESIYICRKNAFMIHLENVVWKEDKYFVAQCLNVDVSSFGETRQKALENLQEALSLYFEDNEQENLPKIEQPELIHTTFRYA